MQLAYESLFKEGKHVTPEERAEREKFVKEFTAKYFELYNESFKDKTGVRFNNLTFEEQGWFLSFVHSAGPDLQSRVYEFIKQHGEAGIRTFLSMEFDRDAGSHVMEAIAGSQHGAKIIEKYNEIVLSARKIEDFLQDSQDILDEVKQKINLGLVRRAKEVLMTDAYDEKTVAALSRARTDVIVFPTIFKAVSTQGIKEGKEVFELLSNISFERVVGSELSREGKATMQEIWESHYKEKYASQELEEKLRQSFVKSFEQDKVEFYVFKYKGEVVSYFSSETVGERDSVPLKHLASFMTSKDFKGGGIGLEVMKKGLDLEQRGAILLGECDVDPARTPIVSEYFENYNFVAVDWYLEFKEENEQLRTKDDVGEPTLALERREGEPFKTKTLSKDEIKTRAEASTQTLSEKYVVSGAMPNFQNELRDGFILTRYFIAPDAQGQKKYYAAFELDSAVSPKA